MLFHDGHEFDAGDVRFTYNAIMEPRNISPRISDFEPIERLEIVDPLTVRVVYKRLFSPAVYPWSYMGILPEHLLRSAYESGTLAQVWGIDSSPDEIAGLGPFRLKEFRPGDRVILERNPHYWKKDSDGNALPYLDELVFLFLPSDDAQVLSFQSGDSHVIETPSADVPSENPPSQITVSSPLS